MSVGYLEPIAPRFFSSGLRNERRFKMKETMTILNGTTFRTALKRVRREFPADSAVFFPQQDGTTLVVRHDVAVRQGLDKRVKYLPKPGEYFHSFQEMMGESLHRGFSHVSINDGDGWTPRIPIEDMVRGYIPRWWMEYKLRFYRSDRGDWAESMTLYPDPSGNGIFYHVKELF